MKQIANQKEKTTTSISEDISKLTKVVDYNEFFDGIDGCAVFFCNPFK